MTGQIDRITQIIRQENKYDSLPPKAVNKILYLANKRCRERDIDVSVPYFWYMFGVMTEKGVGDSPLNTPEKPTSARSGLGQETGEMGALREIVREVLQEYYESGVEGITDQTYRDAPYEVQQEWRRLDKMLRTHHDDFNDFFDVNPSWSEVWDAVDAVYDSFPVHKFPSHEMDSLNWYSTMSRELTSHCCDEEFLMKANLAFWHVFSLSVAEEHRHGVSTEKIAEIIDVPSLVDGQEESRARLKELETRALSSKFEGGRTSLSEEKACDAVAASAFPVAITETE